MNLDREDPKLTAYALGELDADERAEVEAALLRRPDLRRAVDEVRRTADLLSAELAAEPAEGLSDVQRQTIETASRREGVPAAPEPDRKTPRWRRRRVTIVGATALAASIALLAVFLMPAVHSARRAARRMSTSSGMRQVALGVLLYENTWKAVGEGAEGVLTDDDATEEIQPPFNTETYDRVVDNPFLRVDQAPLSTFSIDVDTAAYANMRRFLNTGTLPPADSVRIEEMVNYFSYDYPQPDPGVPFSATVEVAGCPWKADHRLVRVGLKGRTIQEDQRPQTNLVFLLDVSGSMRPSNKLPLLKRGMQMLTRQLSENDRVAIVVYAGASGLVLPSTTGDNQETILAALERLEAGGSTNGGSGIQLAYDIAKENFISEGVNRVVLATDGDFNVGVTNQGDLVRMIEQKAKSGVFLSVLGFSMGNYKDSTLEKLADRGNGNYAYIDTLNEARKVLVDEMGGTLVTIAKDVKIQIEFNPAEVGAYRLIGYENRILAAQDFNDDTKDAGEIGAGHTVTALYEVVPAGQALEHLPGVDPLKYQQPAAPEKADQLTDAAASGEMLTLKLRYKEPDGEKSKLLNFPVRDAGAKLAEASADFHFAAAVAALGMILRDSPYKGVSDFGLVLDLAEAGRAADPAAQRRAEGAADKHGYRAEFIELVQKAKSLGGR